MSAAALDPGTEEVPLYPVEAPRSVAVAVLLSFLWPGLGHFYAGAPVRGVLFALVCLLSLGFLGRFTSAGNAALTVMRHNRAVADYSS